MNSPFNIFFYCQGCSSAICKPYHIHLQDWVAILDDEEDEDEESDGSLGDLGKLETLQSSHPMYFAKKLTEVVTLLINLVGINSGRNRPEKLESLLEIVYFLLT